MGKKRGGKKKRSKSSTPEAPTTGPASNALRLKEKGNKAFQLQDYESAVQFYSYAISEDNGNASIFSNRAASYIAQRNYADAIEDANRCIELKPDWAKGYLRKAKALEYLGQLEDAKSIFQAAMTACPQDVTMIQKLLDDNHIKIADMEVTLQEQAGGEHEQNHIFTKLIDWLLEKGAQFPKLRLKFYTAEYRAIHSTHKIPADEEIMFIPHQCIMTSDLARASDIGQSIIKSKVELRSKHSYLASYLLQERERVKESYWRYYLECLPKEYETIPLFFGPSLLRELEGSIALQKIADRIDSLRLEYDNICRHVPGFKRFPFRSFIWARLVVITRIFGLVIDGVKTNGLVPMADMLNHKRPRETKWTYDQMKRGFVITSLQSLQGGNEVFDSYGRKCNSRFFVNYGFSLEENLDNEALMHFRLSKKDPQYQMKVRFLGGNEASVARDFQVPNKYKEKKVKEMFSFLRFIYAADSEIMLLSSTDGFRLDDIPPLSILNETKCLLAAAASANKSLKMFRDTLEHDNKLLEDRENYPPFSNQRNVILMRRGEKEVLTFYVELARTCIPLFKLHWKDLKQLTIKHFRDDSAKSQYIQWVVAVLVKRGSG